MRNALALVFFAAVSSAATFNASEQLHFDVDAPTLLQTCRDSKKRAEGALAQIAALPATARTFDNTVWALDRTVFDLSDETSSDVFLKEVSVSSAVRAAGNDCEILLSQFSVDIYSREDLYKALKDYAAKREALKGEDARLLEKTLLDFRRSGLELSPDKRAEVVKARKRIAELQSLFNKNINDSKDFALFTKAQLDGLPDAFVAKLEKAGDLYKVGVDYPTYFPFMDNDRDPSARKALEGKFNDRAARLNLSIFKEALDLRLKAAKLLGYSSHAQFAVEPNMAHDPTTINAFLKRLRDKLKPQALDEREVLLAYKRALEGKSSDGALHAWDWRYYDNVLRKTKYEVDSEKVREYFPADLVIEQLLGVYQKLLGLRFREIPDGAKWNSDVRLFEVVDAAGGPPLAYFYMDLFPREGKYGHAAAFNLITERLKVDGSSQKPVSAIVANMDKPTADRPSLLDHKEVETLFHEFGHIMHQTLSKTKYGRFSGSNTAQDFVEAPSQMLENWVWNADVLQSLSGHYKDRSKKLPAELLQKMIAAKNADVALVNLRQLLFGTVDMAYHDARVPDDTTRTYAQTAQDVSLIPMSDGTHPQASFGHLMGGYDAGYYGYMWSKVYAQDMFSVFSAQGIMNPAIGRRYREEILERGSSRDEMDSLKAFLGRAPNEAAFLDSIGFGKGR
jgi:Zn-dependent oligopeptidase